MEMMTPISTKHYDLIMEAFQLLKSLDRRYKENFLSYDKTKTKYFIYKIQVELATIDLLKEVSKHIEHLYLAYNKKLLTNETIIIDEFLSNIRNLER